MKPIRKEAPWQTLNYGEIKSRVSDARVELTHPSRYVYTLRDLASGRCRWGDINEIRADLDHFHDYGTLPREEGAHWQ